MFKARHCRAFSALFMYYALQSIHKHSYIATSLFIAYMIISFRFAVSILIKTHRCCASLVIMVPYIFLLPKILPEINNPGIIIVTLFHLI